MRFPPRRTFGAAALIAGVSLWLAAVRQLGTARVLNGAVFGAAPPRRIVSGPYRLLRDPIHDSYALALAGVALLIRAGGYLALSLESLVVLNLVEAAVTGPVFPSRPT